MAKSAMQRFLASRHFLSSLAIGTGAFLLYAPVPRRVILSSLDFLARAERLREFPVALHPAFHYTYFLYLTAFQDSMLPR
jgi:hypothetical protein